MALLELDYAGLNYSLGPTNPKTTTVARLIKEKRKWLVCCNLLNCCYLPFRCYIYDSPAACFLVICFERCQVYPTNEGHIQV